jgi:phenylacetate-CoA ligase
MSTLIEKRRFASDFEKFVYDCESKFYLKAVDVPSAVFSLPDWNNLTRAEGEQLMLPYIRKNIDRAMRTMPDVYASYARLGITGDSIKTIEDFWNLPVLPKDPSSGTNLSLRNKFEKNPRVLLPSDLSGAVDAYFSGGTKGKPAPTWVTEHDLDVESTAFSRAMVTGGIKPSSTIINCYNPSHKGGEEVHRALKRLGCTYINVKTTDKAPEILGYIQDYKDKNPERELVFIGAQPPINDGDKLHKGGGRTLLDIVNTDAATFEDNVDVVLLGGFRIIPEVERWAQASGKPVFTIYGATEILPAFLGTARGPENRLCTYNNLHVMHGPHYAELLKNNGGRWIPAEPGEQGIVAFTSVFREGTLYHRYIIGDQAVLKHPEGACPCGVKSEIWSDIKRIDNLADLIKSGCCAD